MTRQAGHNSISPSLLNEALNFAQQALTDAGEIALRYFRQNGDIHNKLEGQGYDPVTRADREIEAYLRDKISGRFPDHGIVGEEEEDVPGTSGLDWIIDPIDGTKAFISGLPTWGILLGLKQDDDVLAGFMHQPFTGELFVGSDAGAFLWRNSLCSRLKTSQVRDLEQAILYATHESMFVDSSSLASFKAVASKARLQRYGGDCYAYCMLAHGLIDLVIEDTLQPYDIIPLIPIIEASGGVVTDIHGKTPLTGGFVVAAANPSLHERAMECIHRQSG